MKTTTFSALLIILSLITTVQADTQIEIEAINNARTGKISIQGDKVLLEQPGGPGRMVMDTSQEALYMIDDARKQYVVIDEESLAATTSMMSAMQEMMMAQLQNLPENERKAIEQRLGIHSEKTAAPTVRIDKTGSHKTLHGVKCEVTNILTNDKLTGGACVATPKAAGIPEQDYKTLKKMFSISRKMAEKTSKLSSGMPGNLSPDMFPDLNGVPMETKDFDHGETLMIKKISQTKLSADAFKPGKDYKQFDPVKMMQNQVQMSQPGTP